jgi:hypothetical protein
VEIVALALETIELATTHPSLEHLGRSVDQHHKIWPPPVQRPLVDLADLVDRQASPITLVCQRRIDTAVAHDMATGCQRRGNDLVDVLGAVGSGQQGFSSM